MIAGTLEGASFGAWIAVMRRMPSRFRQPLLCGRVKSDAPLA
jgi:hypothetical protein